ncbi:hypothetical protein [Pedobacter sandarakinus]|uniref:hypothetical protein n=1 Tax=Pedobacter sandarakinus TaxID=353156 RepID=UPI0022471FAC|nr:hypothetical protein [Pedobacter sandarakinus]MCX2574579.1 hypothetical protein [Pedobacter sandarakinus]
MQTFTLLSGLFGMELTDHLKEDYPSEIKEVRGNADALAITLVKETNLKDFIVKLKLRYRNLIHPRVVFVRSEGERSVEKIVLV